MNTGRKGSEIALQGITLTDRHVQSRDVESLLSTMSGCCFVIIFSSLDP